MEAVAIHKSAMIAPRKARLTLDLIRGKSASEAKAILSTTNTKASRLISKVLDSAIANAVNKLYINETYINEGPVLKRFKVGSRSRVDKRFKRTSHIIVKVKERA